VLLLLALALIGFRATRSRSGPVVHYQTAAIDRGTISARVTANGTVSALVTVSVGSQVSGRIATLGADFGSTVKRGQIVATIEPWLFRATVNQARANLSSARANLEKAQAERVNADAQMRRAKALFEQSVGTRAEYETAVANAGVSQAQVRAARATIEQAQAALSQAELNLRYTTIVSPIDGVVISRNVDIGQTVAATLQAPTLFVIAQDLTRMQVDTSVAEADVGKIQPGMRVTFTVDAEPDRTFQGKVRQVRDNAQTLQNVVTYDAVIDVDNGERLLKPGMTASVTFVYAERSDVTRVPAAALRFRPDPETSAAMSTVAPPVPSRPDQRTLWLLRAGHARAVLVRVGISDGTMTEVVEGDVHPGDLAIVQAGMDRA